MMQATSASLSAPRRILARIVALLSVVWLAGCDPAMMPAAGTATGPAIDRNAPVQVALLVPAGSDNASDNFIATNLENAARMAIADLNGVRIDLRVYPTAGNATQAANAATAAVQDGARIILGPLYAEEANAAGIAIAGSGVNLLAFSNNPTIAGGNVFILGPTFRNTANRLVRYGNRIGVDRYVIVHGDDLQGQLGREAIASAIRANGASLVGVESYPMSQQGILAASPAIAQRVNSSGAQAVFTTAGVNSDLPMIATALPEAGVNTSAARFFGLTRWDAAPQALALPGLQGGIFAMPDQQMITLFESRYRTAHGATPHPVASLAYDGVAAIGALVAGGGRDPLGRAALTQGQGFEGTSGIFRFLADGTNERGLAVAEIRNNQVVVLENAPRSFVGAGF